MAEAQAWLTQLYAAKAHRTNQELGADKFVEPNTPSDDVSTSGRQINGALLLGEERLNLLCLDKRDVLARFVLAGEVPISFNSGTSDDTNGMVFGLRVA